MSRELVSDSSSDESVSTNDERVNKSSITTRLCEMIRTNLPNLANHLRRLIGFHPAGHNSTSDINETQSLSLASGSFGYSTDAFYLDESSSTGSSPFALSMRPGNLADFFLPGFQVETNRNDRMDGDLVISTILSPQEPTNRLMISSGVNTSNIMQRLTLADVINENGVIIAQNPADFAAALNATIGYQSTDDFDQFHEPRRIPLFIPTNDNHDYTMSSTPIDSSSSYGSETTDYDDEELDEVDDEGFSELEMLRRRRRLFDNATMGHTVRKLFRNFDDEPPIY